MRIHTDILTTNDLRGVLFNVSPLLHLEVIEKGSRSRARAFEVGLEWLGKKVKGDGRPAVGSTGLL